MNVIDFGSDCNNQLVKRERLLNDIRRYIFFHFMFYNCAIHRIDDRTHGI